MGKQRMFSRYGHCSSSTTSLGLNVYSILTARSIGAINSYFSVQQIRNISQLSFISRSMFSTKMCDIPSTAKSTFLITFSPDGKRMASTHGDHNIYVTEIASRRCVATLSGHTRTPWCIQYHPSNPNLLASGCLGGEVRVWDQNGRSESWKHYGNHAIASLAFHPNDNILVIAVYNRLYFWNWRNCRPFAQTSTLHLLERVRYVRFDPNGMRLITAICCHKMAPASTHRRERPLYRQRREQQEADEGQEVPQHQLDHDLLSSVVAQATDDSGGQILLPSDPPASQPPPRQQQQQNFRGFESQTLDSMYSSLRARYLQLRARYSLLRSERDIIVRAESGGLGGGLGGGGGGVNSSHTAAAAEVPEQLSHVQTDARELLVWSLDVIRALDSVVLRLTERVGDDHVRVMAHDLILRLESVVSHVADMQRFNDDYSVVLQTEYMSHLYHIWHTLSSLQQHISRLQSSLNTFPSLNTPSDVGLTNSNSLTDETTPTLDDAEISLVGGRNGEHLIGRDSDRLSDDSVPSYLSLRQRRNAVCFPNSSMRSYARTSTRLSRQMARHTMEGSANFVSGFTHPTTSLDPSACGATSTRQSSRSTRPYISSHTRSLSSHPSRLTSSLADIPADGASYTHSRSQIFTDTAATTRSSSAVVSSSTSGVSLSRSRLSRLRDRLHIRSQTRPSRCLFSRYDYLDRWTQSRIMHTSRRIRQMIRRHLMTSMLHRRILLDDMLDEDEMRSGSFERLHRLHSTYMPADTGSGIDPISEDFLERHGPQGHAGVDDQVEVEEWRAHSRSRASRAAQRRRLAECTQPPAAAAVSTTSHARFRRLSERRRSVLSRLDDYVRAGGALSPDVLSRRRQLRDDCQPHHIATAWSDRLTNMEQTTNAHLLPSSSRANTDFLLYPHVRDPLLSETLSDRSTHSDLLANEGLQSALRHMQDPGSSARSSAVRTPPLSPDASISALAEPTNYDEAQFVDDTAYSGPQNSMGFLMPSRSYTNSIPSAHRTVSVPVHRVSTAAASSLSAASNSASAHFPSQSVPNQPGSNFSLLAADSAVTASSPATTNSSAASRHHHDNDPSVSGSFQYATTRGLLDYLSPPVRSRASIVASELSALFDTVRDTTARADLLTSSVGSGNSQRDSRLEQAFVRGVSPPRRVFRLASQEAFSVFTDTHTSGVFPFDYLDDEYASLNAVPSSQFLNHRIQVWNFSKCRIPKLSDVYHNVICDCCKVHNEATVDISADGRFLAALVVETNTESSVCVFSLQIPSRILFVIPVPFSSVSVNFSPQCNHLVVGLCCHRRSLLARFPNFKQLIAQVFHLNVALRETVLLKELQFVESFHGRFFSRNTSINSIRFLPTPHLGFVYGTNRGKLIMVV